MRFKHLDLNLLVALDALLADRSVSLAAERLCLSQSATSSALGRLREYFGDELLVTKGRKMVLTARAQELVAPVKAVLHQIRTTIAIPPAFDPASSDRTVTLMASDYMTEVLLSTALREIGKVAPLMRFEILPMSETVRESVDRGDIDILVTIDQALSSDHPSKILFEDTYVVVGWSGNPAMQQEMTSALYFELGHVTARFGNGRIPTFEDWVLRRQNLQRRVEVVTPSFLSVASMLIGSSRITTMHRRLAARLSSRLPLTVKPVPFEIPPVREAAQWHISNNNDPVLRWVVEQLAIASNDNVTAPSPIGDSHKLLTTQEYPSEEYASQFKIGNSVPRGNK